MPTRTLLALTCFVAVTVAGCGSASSRSTTATTQRSATTRSTGLPYDRKVTTTAERITPAEPITRSSVTTTTTAPTLPVTSASPAPSPSEPPTTTTLRRTTTTSVAPARGGCDPNYTGACVPPYPPDVDCRDIGVKNFRSIGSDPHRLDADKDGIACES